MRSTSPLSVDAVPGIDYPPLRVFFSAAAFAAGIEERSIDGVPVRVYNAEKTLAGLLQVPPQAGAGCGDRSSEGVPAAAQVNLQGVYEYAQVCRVAQIIRPYLEAGL